MGELHYKRAAAFALLFSTGIFLFSSDGLAQTTGAAFLGITPSARAYSLGMANGVTALGAEAIGANPANLGMMSQRFDLFTSYASVLDNTAYEHMAMAFAPQTHFLGIDALGVSLTRLQSGNIQGADASGNMGGSYGTGDTAIALSGSEALTRSFRLGLTGKVIQSQIAGYTSKMTPAADLGVTYTIPNLHRPLSIGASITNLGSGIKVMNQTDDLPTAANIGVTVPIGPAMIVLEANRLINLQQNQFGMGVEYAIGPISFRSGYLAQNQSGNFALQDNTDTMDRIFASGLSAGIGVNLGWAKFDYALSEQAVEFGMTQRIALSVQWGDKLTYSPDTQKTNDNSGWNGNPDAPAWLLKSQGSDN